LGTSFRMGRGRVFLLDRHVMNLNFGWKTAHLQPRGYPASPAPWFGCFDQDAR
jgi:hypothetical protein